MKLNGPPQYGHTEPTPYSGNNNRHVTQQEIKIPHKNNAIGTHGKMAKTLGKILSTAAMK
ncbi:MAG TPA: hypothetical protein ACQGQF_01240 [Xylella fastidiosa subsp. pauca]